MRASEKQTSRPVPDAPSRVLPDLPRPFAIMRGVGIGRIAGGRRDVAVRQVVNAVTLATPLGLALARLGRAHLVRGPDGLLLALDYRFPVPAPRAPAVTVGDVVLLRMGSADVAARPRLLVH